MKKTTIIGEMKVILEGTPKEIYEYERMEEKKEADKIVFKGHKLTSDSLINPNESSFIAKGIQKGLQDLCQEMNSGLRESKCEY